MKIQITLFIRPEPGSDDSDGVIFQNTTTANGNTRKWMDDTMGTMKRLVLERIEKRENTLGESKMPDSGPQSASQEDADEKPEKKEAEEERRDAVKGLMLLRCPACKKTFIKFSREWVTSLECSCGEILWLNQDSTARFEFECESCGM